MKLNKYQKRLIKLYKHLKQPQEKLYHDVFYFGSFHDTSFDLISKYKDKIDMYKSYLPKRGVEA